MRDRFLGEWAVTEFVFAPDSQLIGTVQQKRLLFAEEGSEAVTVEQHCQPSTALQNHPMGMFAGDFRFRLEKDGRERFYLGPDVQGFGTSFGDMYLIGEGVWPRFGFNFRSWSIRLSETRQLTGGLFFRGASVAAIILGMGRLEGSAPFERELVLEHRIHGGSGTLVQLDGRSGVESSFVRQRQLMGAGHWLETGTRQDETFQLEPCGADFILRRNQTVGLAKVYGPLLYWETHGQHADSTRGLEISDPLGLQQFSLRQHFHRGQLIRTEALQFRE